MPHMELEVLWIGDFNQTWQTEHSLSKYLKWIEVNGYTAVTGLQFFADHRVCRCLRRFRFKHTQCILYNTPTMQRFSSSTCNAPTMQTASFSTCSVGFPRRVICVVFFKKIMGIHMIQVTSEYEEIAVVWIRTYVLMRTSDAEKWRRSEQVFLMYLFCEQSLAIHFLKDIDLLRSKVQCNTRGRDIKWSVDSTHYEVFRWRC